MSQRDQYEELDDIELPDEMEEKVEAAVAQAERDVAETRARNARVRVNFRWEARYVEVVKRAAAVHGVPYQSFMKQVLIRESQQVLDRDLRLREEPLSDDTEAAKNVLPFKMNRR